MKAKVLIIPIMLVFLVACNLNSDSENPNIEVPLKASGVCAWGDPRFSWVGDFNGDGKSDIASAGAGNVYLYLSTGLDFIFDIWKVPNAWGGYDYSWVGDFNGDGKSDIASADGSNVYMHLSTGSAFISNTWKVPNNWRNNSDFSWTGVGDFNGDDISDIASADGSSNVYMNLSTGSAFNSNAWKVPNAWGGHDYSWVGDFNGDGISDIASANGSNVYMHLSTGSAFNNATWKVPNAWGGPGLSWIGDFNGDGKSDIASANGGNVYVHLSTGNAFNSNTWTVPNAWGGPGLSWIGDFNGDGKSDIASADASNVYVHLSTGSAFSSNTWKVPNAWGGAGFSWVGDFNGDGYSDITSADGCNIYMHLAIGSRFANETWYATANDNFSTMPPYKTLKSITLLDVWGEGRLDCEGSVTGFAEAYNINKLYIPSNCNHDSIPNLIHVSSYENPKFDLPNDCVRYITIMGAPLTAATAQEMYRVLNKKIGVVILYDMSDKFIKVFEQNKGYLVYKPDDPLNAPFNQIKTGDGSYRIYGFPGVPDHDEL